MCWAYTSLHKASSMRNMQLETCCIAALMDHASNVVDPVPHLPKHAKLRNSAALLQLRQSRVA